MLTNSSLGGSIFKVINIAKKRLQLLRAAYLAVKSYSFSYNRRDTEQFICWFTDNSTKRETNAKDSFTGVSCIGSITIRKWTQT